MFYSSTVAAYGYPYENLPLREEHLLNGRPHSSELGYALAKREALKLLEQFSEKHRTKYTYGCITNLYGSKDRNIDGTGHVVVSLIEKARLAAKNNQKLEVWGTGKASRDFLSTKDAAKIVFELFGKNTGVVNIATGQAINVEYIAQVLSETLKLKKGYEFTGEMEGLTTRVCSTEKLEKYSKYVNQLDATESLRSHLIQRAKS
jgi:GDP-L-fucose synthase